MFSGLSAPMNEEFLLSVTRCIKLRTICRAASVHPPYQTLWLNHPPSPPPPSSETGPQVRGRAKSGPVGRRSCNFYFSPLQVDFRFVSLPWASTSRYNSSCMVFSRYSFFGTYRIFAQNLPAAALTSLDNSCSRQASSRQAQRTSMFVSRTL